VVLTRHGVPAVAAAHVIAAWTAVLCTWWVAARIHVLPPTGDLLRMIGGTLLSAGVAAVPAVVLDAAGFFGEPASLPGAVAEAAVVLSGYVAVTLIVHRGAFGELLSLRPGRTRPAHSSGGPR
jgi:PST family polysaccharide transporter